ncbi:hypothetical protein [Microvirga subterranea]|uniref:Uncharacterized protein n=1 Tax=Microvirga subterranea TaxID=186651 RepID=A0A370HEZ4_9HYPH|nr:hypothetical protein [Microvirga subterranea]RDI53602.1 hypothetical protein DES45_11323 [Microvirga subterranea]
MSKAEDNGRLPIEDHNTCIVVFGADSGQAREVAEEIARNAFHNVSFYAGSQADLKLANNLGAPLSLGAAGCYSRGLVMAA